MMSLLIKDFMIQGKQKIFVCKYHNYSHRFSRKIMNLNDIRNYIIRQSPDLKIMSVRKVRRKISKKKKKITNQRLQNLKTHLIFQKEMKEKFPQNLKQQRKQSIH